VRPPSFKKILAERFPNQGQWLGGLLEPINSFFDDVVNGLNKRLTITDNFDGEIKTITANGTYPINLAWNRASRPTDGWVTSIRRTDGSDLDTTTAVSVFWSFNQEGQVVITDLPGLDDTATKQYTIRIIFLVENS